MMNEPRSRTLAFDQLMELAHGLNAGLIMTFEPYGINVDQTVYEAHEVMEKESFDQLTVTRDDEIIGLLYRERLETISSTKKIKDLDYEPVSFKNTLAVDTHLGWVLDMLSDHRSCLVRDQADAIVGLIHISDLNRHAMRLYLYILVSAAETGMAEIIARADPGELWYLKIPENNRKKIDKFYCRQVGNVLRYPVSMYAGFADLVAALRTFPEVWRLLVRCENEVRILESVQEFGTTESLRNQVMHLTKILVNVPDDVRKLNVTGGNSCPVSCAGSKINWLPVFQPLRNWSFHEAFSPDLNAGRLRCPFQNSIASSGKRFSGSMVLADQSPIFSWRTAKNMTKSNCGSKLSDFNIPMQDH